ncbi:hypothetical protein N2152v2_003033 [Parachlorella kessleri]
MVRTRGKSVFQEEFPLFHALSSGDTAAVAALCTPQEAVKCGPGGLSVVMLALLLDTDELLPQLIAAGVPLDATLSLSFHDGEMHKWLAAAELTNRAVIRQELVSSSISALGLAMSMGKLEQAKLLITAGAGLEPLLMRHSYYFGYSYCASASEGLREQLKEHALSHYSGPNLSSAPAALLGQLALLALQIGRADTCLAALEVGAICSAQHQHGPEIVIQAAEKGIVQVVMHMAEHNTCWVWPLLQQVAWLGPSQTTQLQHTVAAELFPYLVQQFQSGKLEFPFAGYFKTVIQAAIRSGLPDVALELLRSKQLQQQPRLLSKDCLGILLRTAATIGHQGLINQLLQQGASVLRLFFSLRDYNHHCSIHSSVSGLLFTHLAQQFAEGSLTIVNSKQVEVLVLRAAQCNQPDACLSLLRTAAARQHSQLTSEGAAALLREAASLGQPALVLHLVEGYGFDHLWELLGSGYTMSPTVVPAVVMHVAQRASAGSLQLDSRRLGLIVNRAAWSYDEGACRAILAAAQQQQVQLTSEDTYRSLLACMEWHNSTEVASLLMHLSAPLDSSQASSLAEEAAAADQGTILELLLEAGAVIGPSLVRAIIEELSLSCLAVLLRRGPVPVDLAFPSDRQAVPQRPWDTCPIVHIMQMLEMLLAAGHRPAMAPQYVVKAPSNQRLEVLKSHRSRLESVQEGTANLAAIQEAAKCGPGGVSVVMVALLLDLNDQLPPLLAANAPLDATLTLKFSDGELHKWLAAAQLTDRAVFRQQVVPGQTALCMAAALGKLEQAKLLLTAGAGLGPLLLQPWCEVYASTTLISTNLVPELREHVLSQYSGDRLAAAPALLLGQLARLACEAYQADTCLAVLQTAVQRSVQLSSEDADALLVQAAAKGQVQVAMHVVKHSPHSVWCLLASFGGSFRSRYAAERLHHSVAVALFAYLAGQLVSGELELENEGRLELLIQTALQAAQPATALVMLQATQNQHGACRQEQQKEQPQEHRQRRQQVQRREQQPLLLSDASLSKLLAVAASKGHAVVRRRQLPVLSSSELEKVVKEAVEFSQPDACISLLRTAAARQEDAVSATAAAAALRQAAVFGQTSVVMHVAQNYGTNLLWPLFRPGTNPPSAVVHEVVFHVAGQVSAGALQLDTRRLGLLVHHAARHHDQEACAAILAAAAQQQVQLTSDDTCQALLACLRAGCPAEMVPLLLRARARLGSREASFLARRAVHSSLGTELEQLLQAGAAMDVALRSKYLNYDDRRGLHMLEMLLAAGHRPMVYLDMILPPATQPVAVLDPLKDRPDDFAALEGDGWWLWLALEPEGWSPASHHKHPPLLKNAFRTVLLAASHGRRGLAAKLAAWCAHEARRLSSSSSRLSTPISGDSAQVAALCTPQEAAKCGPGGVSVVLVALLLDADEQLPLLLAAKAPLDVTLTLEYNDGELHRWLSAAQLTDRAVFRKELVPGQTALRMAAALGKLEQAKVLVTAGAGLRPLLPQVLGGLYLDTLPSGAGFGRELREHALSQYSGDRLAAAPAPLLGQLARLASEACQADNCLTVLQAAVKRGVQLSPGDADALLVQAAVKGQVQVAMHVVKHSPDSIWGLLAYADRSLCSGYAVDLLHSNVTAEVFPYLAQQLQTGELELPHQGRLESLTVTALRAAQPAAALVMLQAAQNQQQACRPEQQQEQPQACRQHQQQEQQQQDGEQQQPPLLASGSLSRLLAVAASRGHADVVQYLLQQGADVRPLVMDVKEHQGQQIAAGRWDHVSIHPSVAPLLFSHFAQQYADGSMPELSSRELEKAVKEAVHFKQPDACISVLRTAAAWQEAEQSAAVALAALCEAASHDQPSVVMYVVRHYGPSPLWSLFDPGTNTTSAVVHEVALHIAGQVSAGAMQLDSRRLGLLVEQAAKYQDQQACAAILAAAAHQQVQLTAVDTYQSLQACMRVECLAELVPLLLRAGPGLDRSQLSNLGSRAVSANLGTVLEQLLQAGAAIDTALVSTTIEALSCSCLAVLLHWGPLPVDTSKPTPGKHDWQGWKYGCPILQVMQMLLAAGHQPMVYRDVILPPATQPVAVFDPLKDRPDDFASLEGPGWWMWLALEPEGWSPASHHQHPPLLESAFRTVLLAAARGRRESAAMVGTSRDGTICMGVIEKLLV